MWLTGLASLRITLAETETRAEANLAVQTAVLERLLDKFRLLSPLLARGPEIAGLIVTMKGLMRSRGIAAIAAGMSGAEEIWLMDASGKVIVSSQDSVPANAIGNAGQNDTARFCAGEPGSARQGIDTGHAGSALQLRLCVSPQARRHVSGRTGRAREP